MSRKKVVLLAVSAVLIMVTATAVSAYANNSVSEVDDSVTLPAGSISTDQARQAAEQNTGGTASTIETDDEDGTLVYEVNVENEEVQVDATSGQVLQVEDDDSDDQSDDDNIEEEVEDDDSDSNGDSLQAEDAD